MPRALLLLIAGAAVALPTWAVTSFREPAYVTHEPELRKLALRACRCAQRSEEEGRVAGEADCWRDLERLAGPASPRAAPSTGSCAGLIERRRCYRSGACVTLRYEALSGTASFCGPYEAAAARTIFAEDGNARMLPALASYFAAMGSGPWVTTGMVAPSCPIRRP